MEKVPRSSYLTLLRIKKGEKRFPICMTILRTDVVTLLGTWQKGTINADFL